ncbi:MAG: polysaccharide deacetylase family protein, partial [Candidatus Hydrogenedentes bacterium]|nr:polysaccharide deacetylase family protein [Candidatus Hydrogenedentota bacterium]
MLALAERRNRPKLAILCYHRILPAARKAAYPLQHLAVTPETFKAHCAVLSRHYEVLALNDAVAAMNASRTATKPLAAITFDDGYRDNLEYAAPILDDAGLKATFFIVAGLVGEDRSPWYDEMIRAASALHERQRLGAMLASTPLVGTGGHALAPKDVLEQAKTLPPEKRAALLETLRREAGDTETPDPLDVIMDWDDLRQLAASGHEIGSHTLTHELLPLLDDEAGDALGPILAGAGHHHIDVVDPGAR